MPEQYFKTVLAYAGLYDADESVRQRITTLFEQGYSASRAAAWVKVYLAK